MCNNKMSIKTQYEPRVSIVIPAYNASNYLAEAIDSALAQTYQNVEIIVVNDGSKDDGATAAVAARYSDKIRYFEKENGGSSSALNCGIKNITGEWFSWLSHDDLYYPEKLEKQIRYLNKLQLPEAEISDHIFFSAADLIDAEGKLLRKSNLEASKKICAVIDSMPDNAYLVAEPTRYNFNGCSCLIHKNALESVGMFDEKLRLLNDVDLWYRLYTAGFTVHYLPEALVKGRIHAKQVSKSIGFSYHNPEQDFFWERTFQWLRDNHSDNLQLFFMYGKNAYIKTRDVDGDRAFQFLRDATPEMKWSLAAKKVLFKTYAFVWNLGKQVVLKMKT